MKTAYSGSLLMSARKNSVRAFFSLAIILLFAASTGAQTNATNSTEKVKPFTSSPIEVLEIQDPNDLLSVERNIAVGPLVIKEREITYFTSEKGFLSTEIWTKDSNGNPSTISSFEEPFNIVLLPGAEVWMDMEEIHVLNLTIQEGAVLHMGHASWYINEHLTAHGNVVCETSKLLFNGSEEQQIRGSKVLSLYDITSNNTAGVSIETPGVNLIHLLQINQGNFFTRGKLTLVSNEKGTAQIGPLHNGADIKNNVIVQRFHQSLVQSWVNLCSPVQGMTVADWDDDIVTTGFPGADYPSYPVNNIRLFDPNYGGEFQDRLRGIALDKTALQNKRGYLVFSNPGVVVFDVEGPVFKGEQALPVSYSNTEFQHSDGWNLVANPYACAIDWESDAWTKDHIESSIYVWNAQKRAVYELCKWRG